MFGPDFQHIKNAESELNRKLDIIRDSYPDAITAVKALVFQGNGCHYFILGQRIGSAKRMKKKKILPAFGLIAAVITSLMLSGCWTSVRSTHPLVQNNLSVPHASVYFIRPRTERFMGMADNRVTIMLDKQTLVELVKGEYTLVQVQPGQTWISVDNLTTFGPAHRVKTESRSRSFTFAAGQTYYISIHPVDGEFRGVYFLPEALTFTEAQKTTRYMRAAGGAGQISIPDAVN